MDVAKRTAQLSYARRMKVGAVAVKGNRICSIGYNGTPAGTDNNCETVAPDGTLVTKDTVMHAEENLILHMVKDGESAEGAYLFLTHAPCIHCARMIYGAGFSKVYYENIYRVTDGIEFLNNMCVEIVQYSPDTIHEKTILEQKIERLPLPNIRNTIQKTLRLFVNFVSVK